MKIVFYLHNNLLSHIDEIEEMLINNRIWKQRLVDISTITTQQALDWGFSGVMLRGSGVCWDLRFFQISKYYKPSAPFKDPNVQMVHRFH